MNATISLKLFAASALALLVLGCSNTTSDSTATAATPQAGATAVATPANGESGPLIASNWQLINFGAPW